MGRKRKAGSIPAPLQPSLPAAAHPAGSKRRAGKAHPNEKIKNAASAQRAPKGIKRRREVMVAKIGAAPLPDTPTPTAPTGSSRPPVKHSVSSGASHPLSGAGKALSSPLRPPPPSKHVTAVQNAATTAGEPQQVPGSAEEQQGTTPSDVLGSLLQASRWTLGSCWGQGCGCSGYKRAPRLSSPTAGEPGGETLPLPKAAATAGSGFTVCACGHRSCAHELVDSDGYLEEMHGRGGQQQRYRYYPGQGVEAGAAASEVAVRLRRLFSAIRNARAVGDCGLFKDSEGVGGWGAGWFLSRLARRYINQARQAMAELGGVLHDPPAVARSLGAAEALMSGSAAGQWTMPDSLPSSCIYQALGTGIASELDLAYWHVRYTAASRFDAGGVTAETTSSGSSHVVPPPEVYFVGLAFHVPSVTELGALPQLARSSSGRPEYRRMLAQVFDLPAGATAAVAAAAAGAAGAAAAAAGDPNRCGKDLTNINSSTNLSSGHQNPHTTNNNHDDEEIRFPVLTNPLLAMTQSAWLETAICAGAGYWVSHFPPRFGDSEGTMRGSDPALPPPIRSRCDATRDWSARLLAFAVPNRRALDACRRALVEACRSGGGEGRRLGNSGTVMGGIVEVGAGLGYWKWVLEHDGAFSGKSNGGGVGSGGGSLETWQNGSEIGSITMPSRVGNGGGGGGGGGGGRDAKGPAPLNFLAIDKDPSRLPGAAAGSVNSGLAGEPERNPAARGKNNRGGGRKGSKRGGGQQRNHGGRQGGGGSAAPTHNEYHGGAPAWGAVEQGGPERLRSLSPAAYPVLLLCYPPPSVGGVANNGCMGADALEKFSGKILLYIGEIGGDTGSPRLEAALCSGWDLVEEVELPCFSSTANRLMVFKRKEAAHRPPLPEGGTQTGTTPNGVKKKHGTGAAAAARPATRTDTSCAKILAGPGEAAGSGWGPVVPMYRCSGCGAAASASGDSRGMRLNRCRLTRAVSYCSEKCLARDGERWRANLEARHVHLAAGSAVMVAQQCGEYGGVFRDKKLFKRLVRPPLVP